MFNSIDKKHKENKRKKHSIFFKIITGGIILHGVICVSASYYLAFTEHSQIAESLSATIITEIIAPIIVYGVTKTIENIFEKNKLAFSVPLKTLESEEENNG